MANTTDSHRNTAGQCEANHRGSASIPTDVKKSVTKRVRMDPMSARICVP